MDSQLAALSSHFLLLDPNLWGYRSSHTAVAAEKPTQLIHKSLRLGRELGAVSINRYQLKYFSDAGERHSFLFFFYYLFVFLSLPVYDYFFALGGRYRYTNVRTQNEPQVATIDTDTICFCLSVGFFFFSSAIWFFFFARTATRVTVSRQLKRRLWLCSGDVSLESTFSKIKIARSFFWLFLPFVVTATLSPTLSSPGYMCFFSE